MKDPRQRLGGGPRDALEIKEHVFFKVRTEAAHLYTIRSANVNPAGHPLSILVLLVHFHSSFACQSINEKQEWRSK